MDVLKDRYDDIKQYPAIRVAIKDWHKTAIQASKGLPKEKASALEKIRLALDAVGEADLADTVARRSAKGSTVDAAKTKVLAAYFDNMKWPQRCSREDVDAALSAANPLKPIDAVLSKLEHTLDPAMHLDSLFETEEFPVLSFGRDDAYSDDLAGFLETPGFPHAQFGDICLPSGIRIQFTRASVSGYILAPSSYTVFAKMVGAQRRVASDDNLRDVVPLLQSVFRTCHLTYHFKRQLSYDAFRAWRDGTVRRTVELRSEPNGTLAVEAMIRVCKSKATTDLDRRIQMAIHLLQCADMSTDHRVSLVLSMSAVEAIVCRDNKDVTDQVRTNSVWLLASEDERARTESIAGVGDLYKKRCAFVHGDDSREQGNESDARAARQLAAGIVRAAFYWRTMIKEDAGKPRKLLFDALEAARLGTKPLLGVPLEFAWCLPGGHDALKKYVYSNNILHKM
jgi:hypothetical protein